VIEDSLDLHPVPFVLINEPKFLSWKNHNALTVKDDPFMKQAPSLLEVVHNKIGVNITNVRTENSSLIQLNHIEISNQCNTRGNWAQSYRKY
jgi:hypothetical protein